ncbi:hypothetical protein Vau01_009680 [Virgisporangium aurantiacum]|uniref:Uncharacterized protein n=1 Tax=Virgisporangium aurantiacum TaxID=175570 RepID=A0A8J3YZJ0_9ACTN|nr:hypothetical protein Vau01_009680 [Virgisporangium aurantiacum]
MPSSIVAPAPAGGAAFAGGAAVTVTVEVAGAGAAAEAVTVSVTVFPAGDGVADVALADVFWLPAAPIPTPAKHETSTAAIPPPIARGSGTPRRDGPGGGGTGAGGGPIGAGLIGRPVGAGLIGNWCVVVWWSWAVSPYAFVTRVIIAIRVLTITLRSGVGSSCSVDIFRPTARQPRLPVKGAGVRSTRHRASTVDR